MPPPSHSALAELRERLQANGVTIDPVHIATAMLGLAHMGHWIDQPELAAEWLERLALELARFPFV